jgi:nucleotide-binding universal stress UspA family protein
MYKNILVPLDGSELAECVLPHVETIFRGCQIPNVIFLRVIEPVYLPVGTMSDGSSVYTERDAEQTRDRAESINKEIAEEYLKGIVNRQNFTGAQIAILTGKAAEGIADFAMENGVDLIIMATHGRSGVSRWVRGSTADKVLHSASMPVLLVRSPGCGPGTSK